MTALPTKDPLPLRTALLLAAAAAVLLPALAVVLAQTLAGPAAAALRERHGAVLLLLAALQAVAVAAGVLHLVRRRLDEPLQRLTSHTEGLASQRPVPPLDGAPGGDFQPLARALDTLRQRLGDVHAELQASDARLHKATMVDALTGLPNRTLMAELFVHEAAVARRGNQTVALLCLGIDRFGIVNDTLGPAAGDELLVGMGQRLAATLRESDFIGRGLGDQFVVLLTAPDGWDAVSRAAERLLRAVEAPLHLPRAGRDVTVSASVGVAMYPSDGGDFESLSRTATLALARSKSLGRGLYSFYQPAMDEALRQRLGTERALALALERSEFELHFQPVVDAASSRVVGCEALLRWRHPTRGLLLPGAFIDDARRCGLIRDIDAWVLDTACEHLASWRDDGLHPGRVALNLSVQQARNPALSDTLRDALERCELEPAQLELEVTEDAFASGDGAVARSLARWRQLGLALTIDDFGTGYASLQQLKVLRPERLKLDVSLVRGLPDNAEDGALAEAVLAVARALGIEVVAVGVENEAQRRWLLQHGCHRQQGHLHGPPMPATTFAAWLQGVSGPLQLMPA